jgi:predicted nucleotidyltransferase
MRLKPEIKAFIKETTLKLFPDTDIFLFGSRVNDLEKGGDIDLLILSDNKIEKKRLRQFKLNFYKKFGWQKIDLVNYTKEEKTTFKELILSNAQPIV